MKGIRFQVFGKVQGVFFRKCTKTKADELNIGGFVYNNADGSVQGIAVGSPDSLDKFTEWITTKGSPASRIDKTDIHQFESHEQHPLLPHEPPLNPEIFVIHRIRH